MPPHMGPAPCEALVEGYLPQNRGNRNRGDRGTDASAGFRSQFRLAFREDFLYGRGVVGRKGSGGTRLSDTRAGANMKIKNSLRSLKNRERSCRVIRRHGRVYVINKRQPRFKARQG